jgi:hypothetical protein
MLLCIMSLPTWRVPLITSTLFSMFKDKTVNNKYYFGFLLGVLSSEVLLVAWNDTYMYVKYICFFGIIFLPNNHMFWCGDLSMPASNQNIINRSVKENVFISKWWLRKKYPETYYPCNNGRSYLTVHFTEYSR